MAHKRKKHINHKIKALRKKKKFWQRRIFWFGLLFLFLVGSAFYLAFLFPLLQVQAITVSGNRQTASRDIQAIAWRDVNKKILGIPYKSVFTVDDDKISQDILRAFAVIKSVKVQRNLPNGLNIQITYRQPYAAFCQPSAVGTPGQAGQDCFSIDQNGVIFGPLESVPPNMIIVTLPAGSAPVTLGQTAVAKNIMMAIANIQENLQNNFQVNVTGALVSNPLVITTSEGWQVDFDPTQDMNLQTTEMDSLLQSQITPTGRKKLQYIYLQYQGKAYYK